MLERRFNAIVKTALILVVISLMTIPGNAWSYNKSWDQGHKCVHPNEGGSTWGRYDYDGNRQGEYPTKDCCIKYCKICPVYANTGRLQKTFTDLSVPGVGPSLTITRTYQSQDWANTLLGRGWMFNFGKRLIVTRDNDGEKIIVVRRGTGEQNFFKEHPDGTLELLADYGVTYDLINNGDGTYTIANKDGSVQSVNADGKTTRIVDKNGNELSFAYDDVGCLARITNASGNYVDFQLGPSGKIANISDNLGRTIAYGYDTNANLTSSTDPMGNTTQYTYDSENRLTSIIDPRGNTVLAVTYDGFQPPRIATFTEKGETWTITYYADRTVKRDSSGNTWTYYFNDVGIIERVIDPLGNETEQSHNYVTSTSMEWEEDANGNRTSYTYDADGNISSKTNPLGNTWNYTYAAGTDRMITETNPSGVVTRYEYDGYGNLIRRIRDSGESLENTTTYTYDSEGNKTSQTDPLGNTTTYQYDAGGNLIRITDPLGNVTAYTYDSRGNKLTETNALGNTTTYIYDLLDRRISVTDALGNTTNYTYDENGSKTSETDANGNTTTYAYDDGYNRLTQMTDPLGNTTSFTYDSRDNRTSMTNANGNTTTYAYDILDRLTRETNALGEQTNYTYDAAGNVLTITDACGNTTTYTYDAANRKISETNAAGETTTYTYDAVGSQITITLTNGNIIVQNYDSLGRLVGRSDSLGAIGSYTYDAADRVVTTTDALANTTTYTYDAMDRIVQIADPTGNNTAYAYDAVGRLLTTTDREGNTIGYTYDAVGRRISETDPLGNSTTYSYDNVGNLISVTDALGNTTGYSYNSLNRPVQETYADGTTRSFTYDAVGNLISRTDQNGQLAGYAYDALNRQTTIDYPGTNDSVFTYYCAGNLSMANNSNATISFTYDNIYRMAQTVQNGQTVAYSHDTAGTKTITYPGGKLIREVRNLRNLLTRVEDASAQPIVQYAYHAADRIQTKTYLNGVIGSFTHNPNSWTAKLTYDQGGSQILGFEYGFDNEGNRLYARKLHDTGNSEQYIYDAKYRLTQFRRGTLDGGGTVATPVTQTAYNLDALGNWTSKTTDSVTENRTHNNMNELVSMDGAPLTYDDNGNLTDDGTKTYEYDYENRLVRVTRTSDSAILGEYNYDALGRRVEKQASGATTTYYYDENRVIEEQVGSVTEATYVYGDDIDEVLTMEHGGQTYFYHTDSLGNIAALANASGNVVEHYTYDPYGQMITGLSSVANPYMFDGRRLDEATSDYYYRNRYYHANIGVCQASCRLN